MLSSDSEHEGLAETEASVSVADVLAQWGLDISPEDIPVLLMPQPIVYLIGRRKWSTILLRTEWHRLLIDREETISQKGWPSHLCQDDS